MSLTIDKIQCDTLIIGGACDKIVGEAASLELADQIKKSEIFIYSDLGHAAYEEAGDFHERVLRFLEKQPTDPFDRMEEKDGFY